MSRFGLGFFNNPQGNDAFTRIVLHMEGANGGTSFPDDNANGLVHTWTANSATTSTAAAKFGSTSLNCGAAAGWIDTPDSADFTLGSGDWTIDFWFNVQSGTGTTRNAFGQYDSAGSVWAAIGGLTSTNLMSLIVKTGAGTSSATGTTAFTTGGWHHYAAVRSGALIRLFLDGTQEASAAISGTVVDSTDKFSVGRSGAFAGVNWNGFIDEFRLSVGIARWTANFTPPTAPYA